MQDFCRPGSDKFQSYIDYIDREEAQRNNAFSTYNISSDYEQYNEYMGNPEKSSGLFTADKDSLTYAEKKELKSIFEMAQDNQSLMWQTVISFDNRWLEKNGVYDPEKKVLDEQKVKETVRKAINRLMESEGMDHAVWSAGIHYNTDNIHVHIATVEPYPMREKMLYEGNLEVRGKFKQSNLNKCKSVVVNEIAQTKEMNLRINQIIRKDIVDYLKEYELAADPVMKEKFLELCEDISSIPKNMMNYNNRAMAPYRSRLDEISRLFLDQYCPEKYQELTEILDRQSKLYEEAYGGQKFDYYKEDKLQDLMQRMGNASLKSVRSYLDGLVGKVETFSVQDQGWMESPAYPEPDFPIWEEETGEITEEPDHAGDVAVDEAAGELDSAGAAETKIESEAVQYSLEDPGLELHLKDRSISGELAEELAEAERQFFGNGEQAEKGIQLQGNPGISYGKYFKEFKEIKSRLNEEIRTGADGAGEFLQEIHKKAETNPFLQHLLGEMYLNGISVTISQEKAQKYFESALGRFERDIDGIPAPGKGKFDFRRYVAYRIGKQYDRGWGIEEDPEIAAEWYERSGQDYAKYALGKLYYEGRGVEQDYEKAFKLFCSAKSPFAKLECAKMTEKGLGTEQDAEEAQRYYKEAFAGFLKAENKEADSLFEYRLGSMLYFGKGCEQNTEEAVQYLREAVKQKNIPAILLLSNIYVNEGISAEDMPQLIEALEELAESGNVNAQYTLGKIYTSDWEFYDLEKGVQSFEAAAEQGEEWAQYQLGKLYTDPDLEIYDLKKGIRYFEATAEQENEWAQYQLGRLYTDPDLEIYDLEKGMQYLEAAAEQGNEWAEYRLGKLYLDPALNIYDVEKGIQYLEASAGQGNEWAGYALAKEYLDKSSAAYNPKKGMEYLSGLAEKGNEWAQVKMGFEYIKGEHVGQDISKAREWFGKAAGQGNETAQSMLNDLTVKTLGGIRRGRKGDPWGELDKAMLELRRSFYEAQAETRKNLLLYEYELDQEMQMNE